MGKEGKLMRIDSFSATAALLALAERLHTNFIPANLLISHMLMGKYVSVSF